MHAHIGDRLVLEPAHLGDGPRTAVITALHRADGTPPYEVRWLDDGRASLIFPGPRAHVEPATPDSPGSDEPTS
jgi:hypothetical protein